MATKEQAENTNIQYVTPLLSKIGLNARTYIVETDANGSKNFIDVLEDGTKYLTQMVTDGTDIDFYPQREVTDDNAYSAYVYETAP